jgi:molybdenum cofactor cytidylyltransferase
MHFQGSTGIALSKALRVERGSVISLVGGGGKTTSMFRLASELSQAGFRVVTTTTTHISRDQVRLAPASIEPESLSLLGAHLDRHGSCLIIGKPDGKGRVFGISEDLISALHARSDVDAILIEADGSRSRPFKAPGEHEPVVSKWTTILVPIAGINALGLPLNDDNVHRPELVASLANDQIGNPITAAMIASVLSHPDGGAKHLPPGARLIPVLNKADTEPVLQNARQIAARLISIPGVDSAIISSLIKEPPVRELWTPVAGIVLAAGRATRFGAAKQILPWQDTTLAAHSVRTALDAGLDPVIAVLGHEAGKVESALAGLPVRLVLNPEYAAGQSTSIRKGLEALPSRTGAVVFLLADTPQITPAVVEKLIQAHRRTLAPACLPVFENQPGNPVLFDRTLFAELLQLSGDTGGRLLLRKYSEQILRVPASRNVLVDIDTPEDYEKARSPG